MTGNAQIMARFIDECWNIRSKSVCRELLSPNCKHYMPGVDQPIVGPEAYERLVDSVLAGFPDARFTIDDVFSEGEKVCLVWTFRATHSGSFNGVEPTNKPILIKGVAVSRILEGKIMKIVAMFDNENFTRQLGAPPEKAVENWKKTSSSASK